MAETAPPDPPSPPSLPRFGEARAGGCISSVPVALAPRVFFCCAGSSIRLYNSATGDYVRSLDGHSKAVTSVILDRENPLRVFTFSLDKSVRVWDYLDGVCIEKISVEFPIAKATCTPAGPQQFFLLSKPKKQAGHESERARHGNVVTRVARLERNTKQAKVLFKLAEVDDFAVSHDGQMVAACSRKHLYLWNNKTETLRTLKHKQRMHCLAFNPSELSLASGHDNGSIVIWQSLHSDAPVTTMRHWHAHPCLALAYTPDGAYLLSGGQEAVLVIWQLASGGKTYLPRLGLAPLTAISVSADSGTYGICCADNCVRLIDSITNNIATCLQGLKNAAPDTSGGNPAAASAGSSPQPSPWRPSTGLLIEPRTGALVLNGFAGTATLQRFDLDRDRHLGDIEVEPQSMRIKGDGYEMRVDSAAFSSDGTTLVTSDRYYSSGGRDGDVSLKFWTLRADGSPPALNTRVDGAHKNSITAAVFHPKEPLMVTVSLDRKFKVWTRQPAKGGESPEEKLMLPWQCRSVGFYRKLAANCAAFSPDGSLLAIGYGPYATLWEPQSSTLREVLPPTTRGVSPIKGLAFIASSPFLVGYTADQLIVWNLLSCTVVWSYSVQTKHLAADATSNRFVIASTLGAGSEAHDFLLVFSAATAKPSFVYICPRSVAIQAVTFAPPARSSGSSSGSNVARIVFLDGNQELVSLEENVPSRRIINSSGTELPVPASSGPAVYEKVFGIAAPALPYSVLSPFSAHTSGSAKADTSALASLASVPSTLRPEDLAKILHGASHALPPIGRLLEPLFARLILPATSNAAASTPGPQQNAVPSAASPSAPAAGPIANGISPVELSAESFSLKLPADAFTEALRSLATVPSADSAQLKRPASPRRAAKRAAPEVAVPAAPAPETPARTPRKKSNNKQ